MGTVRRYGVYPVPPDSPIPPGRSSVVSYHRGHARLRTALRNLKGAGLCVSATRACRLRRAISWQGAIDSRSTSTATTMWYPDVTPQGPRGDQKHSPQHLCQVPDTGHRYHQRLYTRGPGSPLSLRRYTRRPHSFVGGSAVFQSRCCRHGEVCGIRILTALAVQVVVAIS